MAELSHNNESIGGGEDGNEPLLGPKPPILTETDTTKDSTMGLQNSPLFSACLLINTMIGSGILNQPYVFKKAGVLGGVLGYIVTPVFSWLGLNLLTAAGIKANVLEYPSLAKYALGATGLHTIDFAIIVGCLGCLLGYILVVGSTLSGLLASWGCASAICNLYVTTTASMTLLVFPLCLFRHFGHLALVSLFSVLTIALVIALVVIGGPVIHQQTPAAQTHHSIITLFDGLGFIQSFGSVVFSLSCSGANFHVFVTTDKRFQNRQSWMRLTAYVVTIGSMMCASVGIAGYASFLDDTNGIILDNFEGSQFDVFKLMVVLHLILYMPGDFVIMRYTIVKAVTAERSEQFAWHVHVVITVALFACVTGLVLVVYSTGWTSGAAYSVILDITGGILGSLVSFVLPAAIFVCVANTDDWLYRPAQACLVFGILVMVSVTAFTVLDFL